MDILDAPSEEACLVCENDVGTGVCSTDTSPGGFGGSTYGRCRENEVV